MTKKRIGIFGWKLGENSFGVTLPYLEFFELFGETQILTLSTPVDPTLDLVVIPGGPDVSPIRYNPARLTYRVGNADPIREYFDTTIVPEYIKHNVPIFGICRGFQTLAVMFGAKIVQDMFHETNTAQDGRNKAVHKIHLKHVFIKEIIEALKDNPLYNNLKEYLPPRDILAVQNNYHKVNSLHHQAVIDETINNDFNVLGQYNEKEDPAIEVIEHKTLPIAAVQYHPEEMHYEGIDPVSAYLIIKLLNTKK